MYCACTYQRGCQILSKAHTILPSDTCGYVTEGNQPKSVTRKMKERKLSAVNWQKQKMYKTKGRKTRAG